jgi:hypothetical protein
MLYLKQFGQFTRRKIRIVGNQPAKASPRGEFVERLEQRIVFDTSASGTPIAPVPVQGNVAPEYSIWKQTSANGSIYVYTNVEGGPFAYVDRSSTKTVSLKDNSPVATTVTTPGKAGATAATLGQGVQPTPPPDNPVKTNPINLPEPSTLGLFGLVAILGLQRRKRGRGAGESKRKRNLHQVEAQ